MKPQYTPSCDQTDLLYLYITERTILYKCVYGLKQPNQNSWAMTLANFWQKFFSDNQMELQ